jgi:uncharacterized protein (UPF0332 family)
MREVSCEKVYDHFVAQGEFKPTEVNRDIIHKILDKSSKRVEYIEFISSQKIVDWEVVYTLYYDVLRLLSEALLLSDGMKIANHKGCFAYVCVKSSDLELDWNFFEKVRSARNRNKYEASEISQKDWKIVEIQMKLYISTLKREVEEKVE